MTEVRAETRAVRCGSVRGSGLRLRGVMTTLDWCLSRFLISHLSLSLSLSLIYHTSLLWPTFLPSMSFALFNPFPHSLPWDSPSPNSYAKQTLSFPLFPLFSFIPRVQKIKKDEVPQQVEENTSQDSLQGQKGLSPHR